MLTFNRGADGPPVRPARVTVAEARWRVPPAVEFFVDCEWVTDVADDFHGIPARGGQPLIFMIGCGYVEDGQWRFAGFTADRLTPGTADGSPIPIDIDTADLRALLTFRIAAWRQLYNFTDGGLNELWSTNRQVDELGFDVAKGGRPPACRTTKRGSWLFSCHRSRAGEWTRGTPPAGGKPPSGSQSVPAHPHPTRQQDDERPEGEHQDRGQPGQGIQRERDG